MEKYRDKLIELATRTLRHRASSPWIDYANMLYRGSPTLPELFFFWDGELQAKLYVHKNIYDGSPRDVVAHFLRLVNLVDLKDVGLVVGWCECSCCKRPHVVLSDEARDLSTRMNLNNQCIRAEFDKNLLLYLTECVADVHRSAACIQGAFRGWKVRRDYRWDPRNRLGRHVISRMFYEPLIER